MSDFLAQLDDAFGESSTADDAATAIARACVPMLGDVAFVDLICANGIPLRRAGLALVARHIGALESMAKHAADPEWHRYVQHVLETGNAVFEPASASAFSHTISAKAFVLVPLVGKHGIVGVLGALRMDEGAYTVDHLELVHQVARRAVRAIDASRR
jgi:hypothetical protein